MGRDERKINLFLKTMKDKIVNLLLVTVIVIVAFAGLKSLFSPTQGPTSYGNANYAQNYSSAINATTSVSAGTSTLILAAANGTRLDFELSNGSANNINVCKALICQSGQGVQINGGGGTYTMQQAGDNYNGPFSVYAAATSTIGLIYNQNIPQ